MIKCIKCEQRSRLESISDVRDGAIVTSSSFIISPLWWLSLASDSPWGCGWRWGRTHTRRRWSLWTAPPSTGWARGLWRSPGRPPLWRSDRCSPAGLGSSAPAQDKSTSLSFSSHQISQMWETRGWIITCYYISSSMFFYISWYIFYVKHFAIHTVSTVYNYHHELLTTSNVQPSIILPTLYLNSITGSSLLQHS